MSDFEPFDAHIEELLELERQAPGISSEQASSLRSRLAQTIPAFGALAGAEPAATSAGQGAPASAGQGAPASVGHALSGASATAASGAISITKALLLSSFTLALGAVGGYVAHGSLGASEPAAHVDTPRGPEQEPALVAQPDDDPVESAIDPPPIHQSPEPDQPPGKAVQPEPQRQKARSKSQDATLASEAHLLQRARTALARRNGGDAMEALREHEQRFPRGVMSAEREVLTIQALVVLGRRGDAQRRADRFLRQRPQSVFASSIRRALGRHDPPDGGAPTPDGGGSSQSSLDRTDSPL